MSPRIRLPIPKAMFGPEHFFVNVVKCLIYTVISPCVIAILFIFHAIMFIRSIEIRKVSKGLDDKHRRRNENHQRPLKKVDFDKERRKNLGFCIQSRNRTVRKGCLDHGSEKNDDNDNIGVKMNRVLCRYSKTETSMLHDTIKLTSNYKENDISDVCVPDNPLTPNVLKLFLKKDIHSYLNYNSPILYDNHNVYEVYYNYGVQHPAKIHGIQWKQLRSELHRLSSFATYPADSRLSTISLAAKGFAYLGNGTVICCFCAATIKNFEEITSLDKMHMLKGINCPIVSGKACGNISIKRRNPKEFKAIFDQLLRWNQRVNQNASGTSIASQKGKENVENKVTSSQPSDESASVVIVTNTTNLGDNESLSSSQTPREALATPSQTSGSSSMVSGEYDNSQNQQNQLQSSSTGQSNSTIQSINTPQRSNTQQQNSNSQQQPSSNSRQSSNRQQLNSNSRQSNNNQQPNSNLQQNNNSRQPNSNSQPSNNSQQPNSNSQQSNNSQQPNSNSQPSNNSQQPNSNSQQSNNSQQPNSNSQSSNNSQQPNSNSQPSNNSEQPNSNSGQNAGETNSYEKLGIITAKPKRPEYAVLATRLNSFREWPEAHFMKANDLATAGYFYTGYSDCARCFYCGGGLRNWERGDDVWVEHARWFPKCAFLQQEVDKDFINTVQELAREGKDKISYEDVVQGMGGDCFYNRLFMKERFIHRDPAVLTVIDNGYDKGQLLRLVLEIRKSGELLSSDRLYAMAQAKKLTMRETRDNLGSDSVSIKKGGNHQLDKETIEKLRADTNELRQQTVCKICMDMEVAVAFLPCGHFVSCTECSCALTACPLCRVGIKGIVRAYMG